jgi:hypothetical protein
LNEAPERFDTPHRYTCGHFPQSFEYSTVGGKFTTYRKMAQDLVGLVSKKLRTQFGVKARQRGRS